MSQFEGLGVIKFCYVSLPQESNKVNFFCQGPRGNRGPQGPTGPQVRRLYIMQFEQFIVEVFGYMDYSFSWCASLQLMRAVTIIINYNWLYDKYY